MSDKVPQEEPSMEEILASIRRIIADDGEPAEDSAAAPAPPPREEHVLELTQRVDDNDEPIARPRRPEPVLPPLAPVMTPAPPLRAEPVPEPSRPPVAPHSPTAIEAPPQGEIDRLMSQMHSIPVAVPPVVEPSGEDDRLMSEASESASARAFAEIASFTKARRDMLMGNGERTLEDVTRELLRPLLKDWLDQNLPGLVHRLVKEEIERMVRQGAAE